VGLGRLGGWFLGFTVLAGGSFLGPTVVAGGDAVGLRVGGLGLRLGFGLRLGVGCIDAGVVAFGLRCIGPRLVVACVALVALACGVGL
jgi:hypothetical protein